MAKITRIETVLRRDKRVVPLETLVMGQAGADGLSGRDGRNGRDGTDGARGSDGLNGRDGKGLNWRGDWLASATYAPNDVVSYLGSTFISTATSRGKQPRARTAEWGLMAAAGASGSNGASARDVEGGLSPSFFFVDDKSDLPSASGGVITLVDNQTYYFTTIVDLTGDRLVCGRNTTLIGASSENCGIKSTGLTGAALITSQWSLPIRHLQLEAEEVFDLDASGNSNQALDWYGVNLLNTSNAGRVANYTNFVVASMAFLAASGLTFDGTIGTVAFSNSLFTATTGTILSVAQTATITRRIRVTYSSFVVTSPSAALDVSTSATIPVEGYILDTVNFSGGGSYTSGVQYSDNKALFVNCRGVKNSSAIFQYYMQANATATVVSSAGVAYKVAGSTTAASLFERFSHTDNRATYTGALTRSFRATTTVTVSTGVNGQNVGVYLAKNGSPLLDSEQYVTTNSAGRVESATAMTLLELATGDYIEVFVENDTAVTNITASFLNVIAEALN